MGSLSFLVFTPTRVSKGDSRPLPLSCIGKPKGLGGFPNTRVGIESTMATLVAPPPNIITPLRDGHTFLGIKLLGFSVG